MRGVVRSTTMRRTLLRAIALLGAVTGLGLVVAHAGMTTGCNHGNTPESQAPLENASAPTPSADPGASPAATTPPSPSKTGLKGKARYLPATKAAPVFWANDVGDDDDTPAPSPQNAAPQQQGRKGGR
jgi:hypothetical protein